MKYKTYRNYSDDDVIAAVKVSRSIAGVLKMLHLKPAGGNYYNLYKTLQRLNLSTSHFKGKSWSKNEQLKDWSSYSRLKNLKVHLLKLRGHKCECCTNTTWNSQDIPLEIHHLDGDRTNNSEENLQLLCPNCHALTHNWRGRNIKPRKIPEKKTISLPILSLCSCGNIKHYTSTSCKSCSSIKTHKRKFNPTREELIQKLTDLNWNYSALGRFYGVSDNSVRKRIKRLSISREGDLNPQCDH